MLIKKTVLLVTQIILFSAFNAYAKASALAFDIYPENDTPLPTEILPGEIATAFYTVKDNTGGPFPDGLYNYVKHLPKNVTQVTVDDSIPDLCGKTFVLEPYGSCTLELAISGPVSSDCGDADNPCLFVCMSDGFTCAGTKYPLEVTTAALPVLGGYYNTSEGIQSPMLAAFTSSNDNPAWSYAIDSNGPLPDIFGYEGVFIGTTTTGNTALAAGGYADQYGNIYPMVAVSQEGGAENTWTYTIDNTVTPTGYDDYAFFSNIACSGETCVASGQYETQTNTYPLLAVSTKSGAKGSWQYVDTTSYPNGILNSASCDGDLCIVGGQYQSDSLHLPLLLVNTDVSGDGSWDQIDNVPSDYINNGIFFSVTCSGKTCIAGGQYKNGGMNSGYYPLLLVNSNVENDDWEYVISSTGLPGDAEAIGDSSFNFIKGTSCSGNICLAGGNYFNGSNNFPLLSISTNVSTDNDWSIVVDSLTNMLDPYDTDGAFFALSCSEDVCAAGGGYQGDGIDYPMLIINSNVSDESGTWDYVIEKGLGLPINYINGGNFYGVTCNAVMCMAEGYYAGTDPVTKQTNYYPMMSSNLKASWDYYIDAAGPLPSQFITDGNGNGLFCGTTYPVCNNF